MKTVATIRELRGDLRKLLRPIGLVPTMGFLHAGHLALVEASVGENPTTVVSIFVNPAQFGPNEDFQRYPRDLDRDLALLEGARVDLVFVPSVEEVYPPGFSTTISVGPIGDRLEGASRPGHFQGVATVVTKLFHAVGPDRAYFGQKDAQQTVVVRKLINELNLPIELRVIPTVREADGLALSSRNVYLGPIERLAARSLSAALETARCAWQAGERDAKVFRDLVRAQIENEPEARLDYVSVADPQTLDELAQVGSRALLSLAVSIGRVRLIDNLLLE